MIAVATSSPCEVFVKAATPAERERASQFGGRREWKSLETSQPPRLLGTLLSGQIIGVHKGYSTTELGVLLHQLLQVLLPNPKPYNLVSGLNTTYTNLTRTHFLNAHIGCSGK